MTSAEYTAWKIRAGKIIEAAQLPLIESWYDLALVLPMETSVDADNWIKPVNDLLQLSGVVKNDKYMRNLSLVRSEEIQMDHCLVTVQAVEHNRKRK